jgi:hypothetical protein
MGGKDGWQNMKGLIGLVQTFDSRMEKDDSVVCYPARRKYSSNDA